VRETTFANRPGQGSDHVILPEDLGGTLRAVLAIERLIGLVVGHVHLRAPRALLEPARGSAREVRQV
jgi:hypothetical protein